jgi:magnesium transporter
MLNYYHVAGNRAQSCGDTATAEWVSLSDPTEAEIDTASKRYGIAERKLRRVLDEHEDPRTEGLDPNDNLPGLIVLRFPSPIENDLGTREYRTYPLSMLLLDDVVITLNRHELPADLAAQLRRGEWLSGKPEEFALHVLWCVLSSYVHVMDDVNEHVDAMQKELGKASRNQQLYEIMSLQKSLIYFESVLANTMPILQQLRDGERYFNADSYDEVLQAVTVEAHQARTMTTVTERILEQYNTAVSSIVSNNLNIIMKVLTSITIILTIPTVIGGLWGMNVPVPFANDYWAFWGIIAGTTVLCAVSAYILWRHDYF